MRILQLRRLVVLAALLLAPSAVAGQAKDELPEPLRSRIDQLIAADMQAQHIPGLALAVVKNGRVAYAKGYGVANVELDVPVTPTTVFKVGSVSKQFIATGIMLLVQEGRLGLDDLVSAHLAGTPSDWGAITIRHLLSHTSGLLREGPAFDPLKVLADSVVVRSAFDKPLRFPTGTKWEYCNVCYFALADLIARKSGTPWPRFMRDRVFLPSGMADSRSTTLSELVPRRADGYVWREGGYAPAPEFLALRPSGAFLSTVLDLARWDSVLIHGTLLSESSRRAMWTPTLLASGAPAVAGGGDPPVGYGLGWFVEALGGHRRVHHGGSLPGFRAQMSRYPDDGWTVIVLTNGDGARSDRIEAGVARLVLDVR
ncbi:MAG: serine hydrolase domain-containing protein [Gemmatimonadales bacterium]